MRTVTIFSTAALLVSAGAALSLAQDNHGLTARELFYTPPPAAKNPSILTKATPALPPKTTPPATTAQRKTPPIASSKRMPKTTPPSLPVDTPDANPIIVTPASSKETNGVLTMVHSAGIPLALRYSMLVSSANGDYVEVDTDTVFHSGDKLKLQVRSNDRAYLYVANLGSSNNWTVLFPSPDIDNGNNIIEANRTYEVPGGEDRFIFDERKGKEKLVLLLSRKPIENIDQVVYRMNQTQPDAQPARVLSARVSSPIPNDAMDQLRAGMLSRDLVFEKVNDEKKPARREKNVPQTMEKAAYVASPRTDDSAQLVADVTLLHE